MAVVLALGLPGLRLASLLALVLQLFAGLGWGLAALSARVCWLALRCL